MKKENMFFLLLLLFMAWSFIGCASKSPVIVSEVDGGPAPVVVGDTAVTREALIDSATSPSEAESSIVDIANGNGVIVRVVDSTLIVKYHQGDGLKITNSNGLGTVDAAIGNVLVARLATQNIVIEASSVVEDIKVVTFNFNFPELTEEVQFAVVNASLGGDNQRWLTPPWDANKLYFAKSDDRHPNGVKHITMFEFSRGKVADVVDQFEPKGWVPTRSFYEKKGVDFNPVATAERTRPTRDKLLLE